MMNIYEVVSAYGNAQHWVTERVRKCLVRPAELAKMIGMKPTQFYDRMSKSNWRSHEMEKLTLLLEKQPELTIGGAEGK